MFDDMDILVKGLLNQAQLLKFGQSMGPINSELSVTPENAPMTLGSTAGDPAAWGGTLNKASWLPYLAGSMTGIPGLGQASWAMSGLATLPKAAEDLKTWLPTAAALRHEIKLPGSF